MHAAAKKCWYSKPNVRHNHFQICVICYGALHKSFKKLCPGRMQYASDVSSGSDISFCLQCLAKQHTSATLCHCVIELVTGDCVQFTLTRTCRWVIRELQSYDMQHEVAHARDVNAWPMLPNAHNISCVISR